MLQQLKNKIVHLKDSIELWRLPRTEISSKCLRSIDDFLPISKLFSEKEGLPKWEIISKEIEELRLPEHTGGVNIGDQRAILSLIFHFKPKTILEVGTHIGCSTAHLAIAIRELNKADQTERKIDSVDIKDVNDLIKQPWLEFDSQESPLNNIKKLAAGSFVKFINSPSIDFLRSCKDKYDFIFLDGSHSAAVVYQELPLATKLLNKNGIILLHDYFPDNEVLWDNNVLIPGPYLACRRLQNEGNQFSVIPLGELPWFTKVNSKVTSLAIISK